MKSKIEIKIENRLGDLEGNLDQLILKRRTIDTEIKSIKRSILELKGVLIDSKNKK